MEGEPIRSRAIKIGNSKGFIIKKECLLIKEGTIYELIVREKNG